MKPQFTSIKISHTNCSILLFSLLLVISSCTKTDNALEINNDTKDMAQDTKATDYYWYGSKKIQLFKVENKQYLLFSAKDEQLIIQQLKDNGVAILSGPSGFNLSHSIVVTNNDGIGDLKWVVAKTNDKFTISHSSILYQGAFYATEKNGHELGLSQLFYVRLKNANDIDKLNELAEASNVKIIGTYKNDSLLYILHCTKVSEGNALQMANKFYETGKFTYSQPDLFGGTGIGI